MLSTAGQRRTAQGLVMFLAVLIVARCGAAPGATSPTAPAATPAVAAPAAGQAAALEPCAAASQVRLLQTAEPVPPTAPPPTAANPTPAPPTHTPAPAPSTDRVGFPEGYQQNFKLLFLFDRPDNKQVRVICGNDQAASWKPGQPFAYGSILVMETYRAKKDAAGNVVTDDKGHYIREALTGIFVMRKEQGFGADYQQNRSGEWEYVAYKPNKETLVAPSNTANCAACHLNQAGATPDFVFRTDMITNKDAALKAPQLGQNEAQMFIYSFQPAKLTVKVGTTVKWINNDEAEHTVVAKDGSFKSENLKTRDVKPGDSFSHTFDKAGTFEYFCSIHPAMKGTVDVSS